MLLEPNTVFDVAVPQLQDVVHNITVKLHLQLAPGSEAIHGAIVSPPWLDTGPNFPLDLGPDQDLGVSATRRERLT